MTDQDIKRRYYERKSRCPACRTDKDIIETSIRDVPMPPNKDFRDRMNKTYCKGCERYYYIDELV